MSVSPSSALTLAKPKSAVLGGGRKRMSQTEEGVLLHSRETFDATEWEEGGGDDDDAERAGSRMELELEAAYAGADPPPNPAQSEARRAAHGDKPRLFAGRGGGAADDTKAARPRYRCSNCQRHGCCLQTRCVRSRRGRRALRPSGSMNGALDTTPRRCKSAGIVFARP